jgi:hypothetical protein
MLYFKVFVFLELLAILFYLTISTTELIKTYQKHKKKGWKKVWVWSVYNIDTNAIAFLILLPLVVAIPITIIGYAFNLVDVIINYLKTK